MLRVVGSIVAVLLLCGWLLPSHSDSQPNLGAAIHCADCGEADMLAPTVQDDLPPVRFQVKSCFLSYTSLTPQLLASKIYRPPQA
ncbi:MAG: hypothetical protein M0P73_17270 [Syntrophobacterales bacterium]|nr:hypothetical protein [Syntrophobacterales bacterium]